MTQSLTYVMLVSQALLWRGTQASAEVIRMVTSPALSSDLWLFAIGSDCHSCITGMSGLPSALPRPNPAISWLSSPH